MAKVFKIMVPDNSLISRTLYIESLSTELYVIDRADNKFIAEHSEDLSKPALYILANRDERKLYVGKTGDSLERLHNHKAKDFWTEAIVYHSNPDTNTLSTTEVEWLEAKTYDVIKELGYYDLSENKQKPKYPTLKRDQLINCPEYFETAKNYICAAGFDIFLKKKTEAEETTQPKEQPETKLVSPNHVWLLPSSKKRFDLEACFDEYGEVFWRISNNFKRISKGDRGYVYSSDPDKAVLYRFDVIESHIPYKKVIDRDDKFSKSKGDTNKEYGSKGGLFVLIRVNGRVKDKRFSLPVLLKNGLKGAPQGAVRISQEEYKHLLDFIDSNFDKDKVDSGATKKPRRPPFKFSMIGLKPGDTIYFEHGDIPVKIVSDNTIDYDSEIYTLSRFCKHFMPEEGSEDREYQGPAHFLYNGRTLDDIRKEKEKNK